jgi:hypothetical protein
MDRYLSLGIGGVPDIWNGGDGEKVEGENWIVSDRV